MELENVNRSRLEFSVLSVGPFRIYDFFPLLCPFLAGGFIFLLWVLRRLSPCKLYRSSDPLLLPLFPTLIYFFPPFFLIAIGYARIHVFILHRERFIFLSLSYFSSSKFCNLKKEGSRSVRKPLIMHESMYLFYIINALFFY